MAELEALSEKVGRMVRRYKRLKDNETALFYVALIMAVVSGILGIAWSLETTVQAGAGWYLAALGWLAAALQTRQVRNATQAGFAAAYLAEKTLRLAEKMEVQLEKQEAGDGQE